MKLSEWILAIYFTYVTALSLVLPATPAVRIRMLVVNGLLFGLYGGVVNSGKLANSPVTRHLRNWIPLALTLLGYKEMGWLAPSTQSHRLEQSWIVWDRFLFRELRFGELIESSGFLIPSVLEVCYLLVYALSTVASTNERAPVATGVLSPSR